VQWREHQLEQAWEEQQCEDRERRRKERIGGTGGGQQYLRSVFSDARRERGFGGAEAGLQVAFARTENPQFT